MTQSDGDKKEIHKQYQYYEKGFWFNLFIAIFLICFAGMCSGLTVGFLSIDQLNLELDMKNGTDKEKKIAKTLLPLLHKHHLLLSALLVSNAFAMEALPVFLHKICSAFTAIVVSIFFIVIFGEILPQAYCAGPNQIVIAVKMSSFVNFLITILSPITYPLSWILDKMLGVHQNIRFDKENLKALIKLHEINRKSLVQESRVYELNRCITYQKMKFK